MKCLLLCAWILACLVLGEANFTFTYDMAMRCKEHLCQHGYNYEIFYRVDSEDLRKVKKDPDVMFEMHLAILAASNGHFLLSPVPHPTATDPVYEIVIGGGGNKFTELRRSLRRNAKSSVKTAGILSAIEFRAFYIKISEDGLIEFGREGEELPIFNYQDVNPLTIRYFSFASWNGVEAKFLYDCPPPGEKDGDGTNSEAVEQQLSNSDALKRTLLINRDPTIPPSQAVAVSLAMKISSVNYNALSSGLTVGIFVVMSWLDNSLAWNPTKFNDTTLLTFREGQIWSPKFFVVNSDSSSMLDSNTPKPIFTTSYGMSYYHFQTKVDTWCFDDSNSMNRWPRDEYKCRLVIEPWEVHEKITIQQYGEAWGAEPWDVHEKITIQQYDEAKGAIKLKTLTILDEFVHNGWEMTTKQFTVNGTTMKYTTSNNQTHANRFVIEMNLKRISTGFNIVLYIPLIVLLIFLLMSFWTEPLTLARVWFYASCTIVICMGFCYIDYLMPCHTVPSILYLYLTVLYGVLLSLLVHVALMTAMAKKLCQSAFVQNLLMVQCLRSLFCLPVLKTCRIYESINEAYATPEEDDTRPLPSNGNIEEMQSDSVEREATKEVAEIIDKIFFFTFSVVFAVMLAMHF